MEPESQTTQEKKPGSKKACWVILVVLVLLSVIGAGIYFLLFRNTSNQGFSGELSIQKAEIDEGRTVTKTVGTEGTVLQTQSEDGVLYTLTVPEDALILPAEVSLSPLKNLPIRNYQNADAGKGVYIQGNFSFIRPAFLTVQPNTQKPTNVDKTGATKWGRCNIGSRGFDPEICAGLRQIPFNGGVEAEKVVIDVNAENDTILLNPTIPIGQKNVYTAHIWQKGAYLADTINKAEAETFTELTYAKSNDYVNQSEVLMHLLLLKGDLTPYKDQIKRFAREKKDYPREVLKGAIISLAVDNQDSYQARIEDFQNKTEQYISMARGSFMPQPRYVALLHQIDADLANDNSTFLNSSGKAFAADVKCIVSEPPVEETPNWDALDISNWPTELQDYDETAVQRATNNWEEEMKNRSRQKLRDILGSSIYSCLEKAWAAEALQNLGGLNASDCEAIKQILNKCANQCKTLEECEKQGDAAERSGAADALTAVNYRITAFLESGIDCTSQTKKTLETYGQNFCQ